MIKITSLACLLAAGVLSGASAQDITSWEQHGELIWTNAHSNATYSMEWSADLTSSWHSSWSPLESLSGTSDYLSAKMPMFFRVTQAQQLVVTPEVFTINIGLRGTVLTDLLDTDAHYDATDKVYSPAPSVERNDSDSTQSETTSPTFVPIKTFSSIDQYIYAVTNNVAASCFISGHARCLVTFNYFDGSSNSVEGTGWFLGNPANMTTYINPNPGVIVNSIDISLRFQDSGFCGAATAYASDHVVFAFASSNITSKLSITIPAVTGRVQHAQLFLETDSTFGKDQVTFDITDGLSWVTNIPIATKVDLQSLATNPTMYVIRFSPTNSFGNGPFIKSSMLHQWFRAQP
jgi:hypothetical protein